MDSIEIEKRKDVSITFLKESKYLKARGKIIPKGINNNTFPIVFSIQ